jgi:hypothetical protein
VPATPRLERWLIPVVEAARAIDVPVVIASQCLRGAVDLTAYEGGAAVAAAGAISAAYDGRATLTKLMVVLGQALAPTWARARGPGCGGAREFSPTLVGDVGCVRWRSRSTRGPS